MRRDEARSTGRQDELRKTGKVVGVRGEGGGGDKRKLVAKQSQREIGRERQKSEKGKDDVR